MNIQQLRNVVALANSGTFREAAEKLYISQPSLSMSIRDLEQELGFKIFNRTNSGTFLTQRGMPFYEKAKSLVQEFDVLENQYQSTEESSEFSVAGQHYDFLPEILTKLAKLWPEHKDFRLFESTTLQILDEVYKGHSEIGLFYLNSQNEKGIQQKLQQMDLEIQPLFSFPTHIYLAETHPLVEKGEISMSDLETYPTVRFTQEKDEYLYYSENFFDTSISPVLYEVTDRATLNGLLKRTHGYATGSGFLDQEVSPGIVALPVKEGRKNTMVCAFRSGSELSAIAQDFLELLVESAEEIGYV